MADSTKKYLIVVNDGPCGHERPYNALRLASLCLFSVLTATMLGVQVWVAFPLWLTAILVLAIAVFTWRAYSSVTPYGWW